MPIVPTYSGPQVMPSGSPGVRVEAPQIRDTGGTQAQQLGQGLMQAGDATNRIALDMAQQLNQARLDASRTKAEAAILSLTHGADGYTQRKGEDALQPINGKSLTDDYSDRLQQHLDSIAGELSNPVQREAFAHESAGLLQGFRQQVDGHMAQESVAYVQNTQDGKIGLSTAKAALNPTDLAVLDESKHIIKDAVATKYPGQSPEYLATKMIEALTPMHGAVIEKLVQGNQFEAAKAYLEQNKEEITPAARGHLEDTLKIGDETVQAQKYADEAQAKGLSMADALAGVRDKFTGELRIRVESQVKSQYQDAETNRTLASKQLEREGWSAVETRGWLTAPQEARLAKDNPEALRQMRDWRDAKKRRDREDANGSFKTDLNTWYGLRQMAMDDPQQFAALDLRKSAPYLGKQDLMRLTDLQAAIGKGDAKALQTQTLMKTTLDSIKQDLKAAKINLGAKVGSADAEKAQAFMSVLTQRMDQEVEARKADGKPAPTYDELRKIGLSLVQEGIVQGSGIGGWFQKKMPGYEFMTDPSMAGKNMILKSYDDIPVAERDQILGAMGIRKNKYGVYPGLTDEQKAHVERAYTRFMQGSK